MFIDTNVLVYSRIYESPHHQTARTGLERAIRNGEPMRISRQIIREYLSVVTRPATSAAPITLMEALNDVERLPGLFEILEDTPAVTESLVALCRQIPIPGQLIHDANIVATMLTHGERRLLTFNQRDFRRYGGHIDLLPVG